MFDAYLFVVLHFRTIGRRLWAIFEAWVDTKDSS